MMLEIVQAASCEEKDKVHLDITEVHTGFYRHLMLMTLLFLLDMHTILYTCIPLYM